MHTQEKIQSVGRRKWKTRELRIEGLITRGKGNEVFAVVFSHSLEKFSDQAGCRLRKTKTTECLVKHWWILKLLWTPEVWRFQERFVDLYWKTFWGDGGEKGECVFLGWNCEGFKPHINQEESYTGQFLHLPTSTAADMASTESLKKVKSNTVT